MLSSGFAVDSLGFAELVDASPASLSDSDPTRLRLENREYTISRLQT